MRVIGTRDQAMINTIKMYHAEAVALMPEIADIMIELNLNSRMRSCGGKACFRHQVGEIQLNYRLHRDNPSEIRNTYIHELAHIVTRVKYGRRADGVASHGWQWSKVMRQLGLEPERCHTMDVSAYKNKATRITYKCGCQTHEITKQRHNKILRGASYTCKRCKVKLTR